MHSSSAAYLFSAFAWAFLSLLWIGFFSLWFPPFAQYQTGIAAFLLAFVAIAIIRSKGRPSRLPYISFMIVYLAFHFGILPAEIMNPGVHLEQGSIYRWYYSVPFVREALNLSMVFLIGYILASFTPEPKLTQRISAQHMPTETRQYYDRYFLALLSVVCGAWFFIVFIALGITNYVLYNELARGSNSGIFQTFLIFSYPLIGLIFLLGLFYSRKVAPLMAVFGLWGVSAFVTGLRGEVLFPLAMSMPILIIQGRIRFRPIIFTLLIVVILISSSFVRGYRNTVSVADSLENTSMLTGLAELGGSLRPAYESVRWISTGMMEFQHGASYYAPFERTFLGFVPIVERLPAREDLRLMNVAIFELTNGGSYGFSIAAEAYINFGLLGTFFVGLVVGTVMLRFGRKAAHELPSLVLIALVYAFYYHIRQAFVGAFGSFVVVLVAGIAITSLINRKSLKSATSEVAQQE